MNDYQFAIPDIIAMVGVVQCVYILVYMAFRSGRLSRGTLPIIYFITLGTAFFMDAASNYISPLLNDYDIIQWALWFSCLPLSVLLIIQIAQIERTPALQYYSILLLIPISVSAGFAFGNDDTIFDAFNAFGLIAGGISVLLIWLNRDLYITVARQKKRDRYWTIIAIVLLNIGFLIVMMIDIASTIADKDIHLMRSIIGIGFVYLMNTSLFRIYPQAIALVERRSDKRLSENEHVIARRIESLLSMDKVYQEPTYSRADLAKECDTSEAVVSKITNVYFQKSFSTLMNDHRVDDAKRLLDQTDAPVKEIAENSGFNSLASFNRVFKNVTGQSPSQYRN